MPAKSQWNEYIKPLIKKYRHKQHPLQYANIYECMVMVILSAQSNDDYINKLAPALFEKFPTLTSLSKTEDEKVYPYVKGVISYIKKTKYITDIAKQLKSNKNIPLTLDELVALPGIGRKSANVIVREAGVKAEGIMVDLHVVRVAERLGLTKSDNPKIIEQDCMKKIDEKDWSEAGMAMSFLGREICRPKPLCPDCLMNSVCQFYLKGNYEKLQKQIAKAKTQKGNNLKSETKKRKGRW